MAKNTVKPMLESWLNRIMNKLLSAAALVSRLKKKNKTTRLIGPPPIPRKLERTPSANPINVQAIG